MRPARARDDSEGIPGMWYTIFVYIIPRSLNRRPRAALLDGSSSSIETRSSLFDGGGAGRYSPLSIPKFSTKPGRPKRKIVIFVNQEELPLSLTSPIATIFFENIRGEKMDETFQINGTYEGINNFNEVLKKIGFPSSDLFDPFESELILEYEVLRDIKNSITLYLERRGDLSSLSPGIMETVDDFYPLLLIYLRILKAKGISVPSTPFC